jgi:trk system potassium uptake protein TrkA
VEWFGRAITEIERAAKIRVAFLTRLGEGLIPDETTVLQDGDLVHISVRDEDLSQVESILGKSPEA